MTKKTTKRTTRKKAPTGTPRSKPTEHAKTTEPPLAPEHTRFKLEHPVFWQGEAVTYIDMKNYSTVHDRNVASINCEKAGIRTPETFESHHIGQLCSVPHEVIAQLRATDNFTLQTHYLKSLGYETAISG